MIAEPHCAVCTSMSSTPFSRRTALTRAICVPTVGGKRGNPVLWARRFFPEMAKLSGDSGAKHLIGEHADLVCEVEMAGEAAITDIDTPEALAAWRARST